MHRSVPRLAVAIGVLLLAGVAAAVVVDAPSPLDANHGRVGSNPTVTSTTSPLRSTTSAGTDLVAAGAVAPIPVGPVRALTLDGFVAPIVGGGPGAWSVRTPCGATATVTGGDPLNGAHVVLDPGHGGDETGAVGAAGVLEKDLNLAVAQAAAASLRARGLTVVLTRDRDLRMTLETRAQIATTVDARAFVSIHHNADPDGPSSRPGTETFFQIASVESRRLAGILWEEVTAALAPFDVAWVADTDAGAKYRSNSRGGDYYGVLRHTAGVPSVLAELAYLSNPAEEALVARPDVHQRLGGAVADAIVTWLTTDEPGGGYTEPYPRTQPAGPGGGQAGCVDPPLQ
ncbi:MAG TPA: N-acetylmuramoyl-L-alanine amidase [Acidimicrobiales bacterium]